jgi:putative transcriptional regulator
MEMHFNLEKVAHAIEMDAGEYLPELRQALAEAQAGIGRITKPKQLLTNTERSLYQEIPQELAVA